MRACLYFVGDTGRGLVPFALESHSRIHPKSNGGLASLPGFLGGRGPRYW